MLDQLMTVRGVKSAAVLGAGGEVLSHVGFRIDSTVALQGREVVSGMASALSGGEWRDVVIDFEDGPVMLVPLGTHTLLASFDDVAILGRLRYAVKRALPELQGQFG
ncbi:roadblock/LC7 domain-containing protein [Deinococcus peraridilitoris]|uniref:Roadblock/LC7 domain-containing protein n=1 Tax=Deinococcus peraridilitoris (strain DSM 19664 / LMG 22246 / CIP 109416 / KR-200) TaxID=937777 RepID=L0A0K1_DEIPD|nr:roadblock/LC7 domain-containing protein [Deinococcus peraridilitoris]AFZ66535.1 Roadblock/LC7 domain-containing protein [Deinococcus peraridilitoris DSM 19664]